MGYWVVGAGHVRPGCGWCTGGYGWCMGGYGWCPGGYGKAAGRACPAPTGRQFLQRAAVGRPVKAPPAIALLGHLPCEGRLPRGQSPRKKAPLSGQTPPIRGRWRVAPEGERWPREARPEGLCPFAAAAHFAHSAGASVASGTGVSSGCGAFASRYA